MADINLIKPGWENLDLSDIKDDDDSSPECFLVSGPLQDQYDSDVSLEHQLKQPFLTSSTINANDIKLWEMIHFMNVDYSGEPGLVDLEATPSIEDLVTNAFHFICPAEIPPKFFHRYCKSPSETKWKTIAQGLVCDFFKDEKYKWIKNNFIVDYTDDGGTRSEERFRQIASQQISLSKLKDCSGPDPYPFYQGLHLVHRIDAVFRKNPLQGSSYSSRAEKDEVVKGAFCDLLSFAGIPVLLNGETRVDFDYNVPGRTNKVCFNIKPDAVLWHYAYSPFQMEFCCAIEVCSSHSLQILDKQDTRSYDDHGSDHMGQFNGDCVKKKLTFNALTINHEKVQKETSHSEISNEDTAAREKTMGKMKLICPAPIKGSDNINVQKCFAKLGMDMYGLLVAKYNNFLQSWNKYSHILLYPKLNVGCIGLFVHNEHVCLLKMAQSVNALNCINHGDKPLHSPEIVMASDWWFNLKKPNDRFALMIFLRSMLRFRMYNRGQDLSAPGVIEELANNIITKFSDKSAGPDTIW